MIRYLANVTRSKGDPKILRSGPSSRGWTDNLARFLGWFSIGLGLAELMAPRSLTRALGMQGHESLVRAYGAREIGAGIMTLSTEKEAGLWSRVAGDALDIATLVAGLTGRNRQRGNVVLALTMVVGVTALDVLAAQGMTARHSRNVGARRSYHDRSGFPKGIQAAKAAARDFARPRTSVGEPVQRAVH